MAGHDPYGKTVNLCITYHRQKTSVNKPKLRSRRPDIL